MSGEALYWACLSAPTRNPAERAILIRQARPADRVGCGSFLAKETLMVNTGASWSTVKRTLRELRDRGLIAPGDQDLPRRVGVRADRQPIVWDLQIPYDRLADPDEINTERRLLRLPLIVPTPREECEQCARLVLPADYARLVHLHRPPLADAAALEATEDRPVDIDDGDRRLSTGGSHRPPVTRDGGSHRPPVDGGSHRPPVDDGGSHRPPVTRDGGSPRPPEAPRGVTQTPEPKEEEEEVIPPPTPTTGPAAAPDGADGGQPPPLSLPGLDPESLRAAPEVLADVYDRLLVPPSRQESGRKAVALITLIAEVLSAGWGRQALTRFVCRDTLAGVRSVYAVLKARLEEARDLPPRADTGPPPKPTPAQRPRACGNCFAGTVMAGDVGGVPCPRCRPEDHADFVAVVSARHGGIAIDGLDQLGIVLARDRPPPRQHVSRADQDDGKARTTVA